jgi:flagellin
MNLTAEGNLQLTDDVAAASQSNFTLTVNDRSSGGGTFGTLADSGQLVREGMEETATVQINGGPAQRITAGQTATIYGSPQNDGEAAPQLTMTFDNNLTEGTDTIRNTRAAFSGSLNGGPEVRFEAGEQDVRFVSGARPGENVTLDFDATIDVPNPDEGGMGSVVISATGNQANYQMGANAGQNIGVSFGDLRPQNLGLGEGRSLEDIDITQEGGVSEALEIVDAALDEVNQARGTLGAYSNRLESSANGLSVASENMLASQSRITDADFARESTRLATNQMVLQANLAMQSQVMNLHGNMFLDLLR